MRSVSFELENDIGQREADSMFDEMVLDCMRDNGMTEKEIAAYLRGEAKEGM